MFSGSHKFQSDSKTLDYCRVCDNETAALSIDSVVVRMVRLVIEAESHRSKIQMLVEKIAKYYTPGIVPSTLFNCENQ